MDTAREPSLRFRMIQPEGGRQIARITCRRCGWAAEVDSSMLKGMYGKRLYRTLVCSACGARDAEVSIRWETPPARPSR
jgi:C4-type Zn-finger protein